MALWRAVHSAYVTEILLGTFREENEIFSNNIEVE